MFRLLLVSALAFILIGCANFDGKMVDAQGNSRDCSTMGGGIGLGAIVGMGAAAISNHSCESTLKERGYVLEKNVGISGITLYQYNVHKVLVDSVSEPALDCVDVGDELVKINDLENPDLIAARKELFGEVGKVIDITYLRDENHGSCQIMLANPDKLSEKPKPEIL